MRTALFIFLILAGGILSASDFPKVEKDSEKPSKQEVIRPLEEGLLKNRLQDLERRQSQLEQDLHFMEEKIRSLDRRIDDLRSRHI